MDSIYSKTKEQLEIEMLELNQKKFRATQIFTWLYQKKVDSFTKMSDISLKFIPVLLEKYSMELPKIIVKQVASDGTIKLLLELSDGAKVETVLMRYDYGLSLCVSSQVGCNMGCAFCASGLLKKQRNLTAGEIKFRAPTAFELTITPVHYVVMAVFVAAIAGFFVYKFVALSNLYKKVEEDFEKTPWLVSR